MANSSPPKTRGTRIFWARFYDPIIGIWFLGQARKIHRMTLELAEVQNGDKVLDVGCGTGSLALLIKPRVDPDGKVMGIDADPVMIGQARRKSTQRSTDVTFQVGLVEKMDFPTDSFDLVVCNLLLHHLPDDLKRRGATEIFRVLKPGGRFLAVDFEPPNHWASRWARLFRMRSLMQSNVGKMPPMMTQAGFKDVKMGVTRYKLLSFVRGIAEKV